jgi:hypothetical protein
MSDRRSASLGVCAVHSALVTLRAATLNRNGEPIRGVGNVRRGDTPSVNPLVDLAPAVQSALLRWREGDQGGGSRPRLTRLARLATGASDLSTSNSGLFEEIRKLSKNVDALAEAV